MDRRRFLQGTAIAGAVGVGGIVAYSFRDDDPERDPPRPQTSPTTSTPLTPPPAARPVRHENEFGTVVDAVRAGADPDGNEPIGEFLERYADADTLLSFPAGEYRLPQVELADYDHLGIAAAGDERPTFVAPAGTAPEDGSYVEFVDVTDFVLDGIDFDFRREGAGGPLTVIAAGDATVRDVSTRGSADDQVTALRVDVRAPNGRALVENVRARQVQDTGWLTGAYVGRHHSGSVTFRNCLLADFTDNGLYGSSPGVEGGGGGSVHTENSRFENNNISNVRFGTTESSATGDDVVVDAPPGAKRVNLRGIRFRRGSGQTVDDVHVKFGPAITQSFGAVVFHADNGGAHVTNSTLTVDGDGVPAVNAFYPTGAPTAAPTFENLTVDGTASRGFAVQIHGRNGTTFRDCTFDLSGDRRDGIRLAYSADCELVDSRVDVTGAPLVLRESTLSIRNTTFVTPAGERHVDAMDAGPGDFRPSDWAGTETA